MSSKDVKLKREQSRAVIRIPNNHEKETKVVSSSPTKSTVNNVQAKPVLDFNARVDHVGQVKDNISVLYADKFKVIRDARKIRDAEDIRTAPPVMNLPASATTKLPPIAWFKEDDTHVPTKAVALFPVADFKYFPARKSGSYGWQVGLRSYFQHEHEKQQRDTLSSVQASKSNNGSTDNLDMLGNAMEFSTLNDGLRPSRLLVSSGGGGDNSRPNTAGVSSRPTTAGDQQDKAHYTIPELELPSPDVTDRYFGDAARDSFYATYAQLKSRGEILPRGYAQLKEVLKLPDEENPLVQAIAILETAGVISAREHDDDDEESGVTMIDNNRNMDATRHNEKQEDSYSARSPLEASRFSLKNGDNRQRTIVPSGASTNRAGSIHYVFDERDDINDSPTLKPSSMLLHRSDSQDSHDDFASPIPSAVPSPSHKSHDHKNTTQYHDDSLDVHYHANSPRAIFLAGCLEHKVPPITAALIRKKLSSTVNISHMGLGNKIALLLAPCISAMPYLQVLNLTDNHLQDTGLAALISSIAEHPHIELLDISQNVIGSDAADALADFIGNPECRLQCLRMSDANIDDGECARFVEVLMRNIHLKELDMSCNLLGKDENLNAVQPDFVTGGESLSELIRHESCPIQILNLHWNMIRLEGAEVLCDSIQTNRTLTHLDLSYNALGRSAAVVLGAALMINNVIKEINIAQNGIDAVGCFSLCVGVRENRSLHFLNLDGNPVGEMGGRILIKLAASEGHRLNISAKNCDVTVRSSDILFDINDPCKTYEFNLSRSYERACVLELLDIAAGDPTVEISSYDYNASDKGGGPFVPLKLTKFIQMNTDMASQHRSKENRELKILESMKSINAIPVHTFRVAVQKYDTDGGDLIKLTVVPHVFQDLHIKYNSDFLAEIKIALDNREQAMIDVNDFVEYITRRGAIAVDRIHDLTHKVICSVSTEPNKRYIPPMTGIARIKVNQGYSTGIEYRACPISHSKVQQVIATANLSSNPLALLQYSLDSSVMYLEEARLYYQEISSKTEDSVSALAKILLRMQSAGDALRMVKSFVGNDILRIRRLRQILGSAYYPLVGMYSGYYSLDLSNDADRTCLKRLIEKSVSNETKRKSQRKGDTSQLGNWSCFRNELHFLTKGSRESVPEMTVSPKYYFPMPRIGRVEFDFVNTDRPDPRTCKPEHEDRLIDCILISRLLHEDQIDMVISRLAEFSIACRKSFISNGAPYWKAELGRALSIGDHLYTMYGSLSGRRASGEKCARREIIKATTATVASVAGAASSSYKKKIPAPTPSNVRPSLFKGKQPEHKPLALLMSERTKEMITKFRSVVHKGLTVFSNSPWRRRLYEVMLDTKGASDEYKSAAMLEYFESELASAWLYCKYVAMIIELFRSVGTVAKSSFGSYRVHLVVMVFDRIVDLHNFELVLMVLSAEEHAAVIARIGLLNIFNPSKPEGGFQLDLTRWEERQVAKMLIHLSVVEPGENWANKGFIFDRGFNASPGWDLTVSWLGEEGLPKKGILSFEMFAGDGLNLTGCLVDHKLRNMLTSLVLVEQRDLVSEIENDTMLTVEHNVIYRKGTKSPLNYYPDLTHPGTHIRPTLPLLKLISQSEVFPLLNKPKEQSRPPSSSATNRGGSSTAGGSSGGLVRVNYAVDDANAHLANSTDITWNYGNNNSKSESWQLI